MTEEDNPELVGSLNTPFGLKGFEKAEIGHPVFQLRDRYIIFLKSETMLVENAYNNKLKQSETKKFFYSVCVPFYMETLKSGIDFLKAD